MTRILHWFLCERWIPCQTSTSILCLHYRQAGGGSLGPPPPDVIWSIGRRHAHHFRLKSGLLYLLPLSSGIPCLSAIFYLYQTKSLFRPTFGYWITTFYSSLESLEQKKADCTIFAMKFCINFCTNVFKRNFHIFSFP